ncbi:MAG: ATP-binding protein [Oscillospiraceae bacterium]|nr:ATP-binding protein [Oscillospiraceae bacterium]
MTFLDFVKTAYISVFAYLLYVRLEKSRGGVSFPRKGIAICGCVIISVFLLAWLEFIEPINSMLVIAILGLLISLAEKSSFRQNVFFLALSYGASYVLYSVSTFISSAFLIIFGERDVDIWFMLLHLAIETAFILILFNIKFKIIIKYNNSLSSAGVAIAGVVLIIYGVIREEELSHLGLALLLSGIVLCGLGLYWWLKKESITNYNEKSQKLINARQQAEIAELNDICLELEKVRHTDNKKLPAYREAVVQAIATGDKEAKIALYEGLKAAEMATVMDYTPQLPTVGILLVDIVLDFNKQRCSRNGIELRMEKSGCFGEIVEFVPQSQLETIIVNLLDNAFESHGKRGDDLSARQAGGGEKCIVVRFSHDRITVEDNGAAFSDSVLADMERCKESLTPNRGEGVGLGYVTMFEITNECRASVVISQKDGVKSVTVRFDGENRLLIYNRKETTV